MPNWCSNTGHIKGDPAVIKEMWDIIHTGSLESDGHDPRPAITALRPCPPELTGTMAGFMSDTDERHDEWVKQQELNKETYGYTDWYGWCVDNWGTKWTPNFAFELSDDGTTIEFQGDSAWSPPCELLRYITEKYPVYVEVSYTEEGMFFIGSSIFQNGNTYESCGEPSAEWNEDFSNDEEFYDAMDRDLAFHEQIAHERYLAGEVQEPPKVLLGRDILPKIGEASITTTLAGEVSVALDFPQTED